MIIQRAWGGAGQRAYPQCPRRHKGAAHHARWEVVVGVPFTHSQPGNSYSALGGLPIMPQAPPPGLAQACGGDADWAFLSCPPEDECANGHHDCNETQDCRDLARGYACACKSGYTLHM